MGLLVASQAEGSTQVGLQIRDLADVGHDGLVDLLLVLDTLGIRLLLLLRLALLEELLLALALLLLTCPVLILAHAIQDLLVGAGDVDRSRGGNDIAVVDTAQWHAIGLERTSDEQHAL